MCKQSCPSEFLSYRESDTPRGRAMLLHSVYFAEKEFTQSTVEAIYNCFVCGSCKSWCAGFEAGAYNIPELMKFARKDIVQNEIMPEVVLSIKTSLMENDNPYHKEKSASFSQTIVEKKADILYFMGSEINFGNPEIAKAAIRIYNKLNISYTLLRNEPDSGKILDLLGFADEAIEKASQLYERIISSGCKTVVVSDPLAYDAFKNDYPGWGFKFDPEVKIVHLSEYLAVLIKSGSLRLRKTTEKITLADSEFLGRFNNIFEEPREIIKSSAGENFIEMRWNREKLLSTGEAAFTFNQQLFTRGDKLGEKIRLQAFDSQCKHIVTLSATAKNNIGCHTGIKAIDIAEFVAGLL
jgi:Fe-S oxidoreductase